MNRSTACVMCAATLIAGGAGAIETGHSGLLALEADMKRTLGPALAADDIAAGQVAAEKWKTYASNTTDETGGTPFSGTSASVAEVLSRHQDALMAYPNVVAVSDGICQAGEKAGQACINVYVSQKVPVEKLADTQKLPERLDGVPVEVIEAGEIGTLPMK